MKPCGLGGSNSNNWILVTFMNPCIAIQLWKERTRCNYTGQFIIPSQLYILGFSYRASFLCVTIRIINRCDFFYYVFISLFSSFPYMFRAFMGPSSGVFQAVVFMLPFGSCSVLLVVCVRQRTGLWWWLRCTTTNQWLRCTTTNQSADARIRPTKHCMNQMVA